MSVKKQPCDWWHALICPIAYTKWNIGLFQRPAGIDFHSACVLCPCEEDFNASQGAFIFAHIL